MRLFPRKKRKKAAPFPPSLEATASVCLIFSGQVICPRKVVAIRCSPG
jgi:hypothetical protein